MCNISKLGSGHKTTEMFRVCLKICLYYVFTMKMNKLILKKYIFIKVSTHGEPYQSLYNDEISKQYNHQFQNGNGYNYPFLEHFIENLNIYPHIGILFYEFKI